MTREEARHWLEIELKTWEDECKSKHPIKEALSVAIKALEQEPVLDKISAEIAEYGSIWVEYKITGRRDKDIEQLVTDVLKQAKKQVLDVIDKYKAEVRERNIY